MSGRLKLGMVGGGEGAFIGGVHRMAARLDDRWTLVAGAFSSDAARSQAFGRSLGLATDRCYGDWRAMATAEAARPDRIDAVAIVTPNHMHHGPARAFLDAGIAVICDKPLTTTLSDALDLDETVTRTGLPFVLTHNYSGYAMVRQMRAMVAEGVLGAIRVVQAEYAQEWLATDQSGNKQADWRGDPERAGGGGALGDIATHAYHLAGFVTGETAEAVSAETSTFVPGRRLDDDVQIRLRWTSGARGQLWALASPTACACASTARRQRWNGRKRSRTCCASRGSAKRRRSCGAAGRAPRRRPRPQAVSQPDTLRATSKASRRSTPTRPT
jgi:predicted dehydrogenase